jgi:hypothetical protein
VVPRVALPIPDQPELTHLNRPVHRALVDRCPPRRTADQLVDDIHRENEGGGTINGHATIVPPLSPAYLIVLALVSCF